MRILNFKSFGLENINEGKYDSITRQVVNDIMIELKEFIDVEEDEYQVELSELYELPSHLGLNVRFLLDLYLFKEEDLDTYKIDADAPGNIKENDIRVVIYIPTEGAENLLEEIYHNLIYTLRHEIEHIIQVFSEHPKANPGRNKFYSRITADEPTQYKYSQLFKGKEIEPQVYGYYLQAKKQRRPFEEVVREHLDKLVKNGQYEFRTQNEYEALVKTLVDKAKDLGLNIK